MPPPATLKWTYNTCLWGAVIAHSLLYIQLLHGVFSKWIYLIIILVHPNWFLHFSRLDWIHQNQNNIKLILAVQHKWFKIQDYIMWDLIILFIIKYCHKLKKYGSYRANFSLSANLNTVTRIFTVVYMFNKLRLNLLLHITQMVRFKLFCIILGYYIFMFKTN